MPLPSRLAVLIISNRVTERIKLYKFSTAHLRMHRHSHHDQRSHSSASASASASTSGAAGAQGRQQAQPAPKRRRTEAEREQDYREALRRRQEAEGGGPEAVPASAPVHAIPAVAAGAHVAAAVAPVVRSGRGADMRPAWLVKQQAEEAAAAEAAVEAAAADVEAALGKGEKKADPPQNSHSDADASTSASEKAQVGAKSQAEAEVVVEGAADEDMMALMGFGECACTSVCLYACVYLRVCLFVCMCLSGSLALWLSLCMSACLCLCLKLTLLFIFAPRRLVYLDYWQRRGLQQRRRGSGRGWALQEAQVQAIHESHGRLQHQSQGLSGWFVSS